MIAQISGELINVAEDGILLKTESITYHLSIPACDFSNVENKIGTQIECSTLYYLEGQGQGSNYRPRLIGFQSKKDLDFFECFTKVKGVGPKKALKAMVVSASNIAEAISSGDTAYLINLPEIGKRTAETIIAELRGKVDMFIVPDSANPQDNQLSPSNDAVLMLIQLGESPKEAKKLIAIAMKNNQNLEYPEDIVKEALALK